MPVHEGRDRSAYQVSHADDIFDAVVVPCSRPVAWSAAWSPAAARGGSLIRIWWPQGRICVLWVRRQGARGRTLGDEHRGAAATRLATCRAMYKFLGSSVVMLVQSYSSFLGEELLPTDLVRV